MGIIFLAHVLFIVGADLSLRNKLGNYALMIACETGHICCVKALLEHSCPLELKNKARETPLMVATRCGQIECIKTLLVAGADVHVVGRYDQNNIVPCFAVKDGHTEALRVLFNHSTEALTKWKTSSKQKILTEILIFDQLPMLKMLLDEYDWPLSSTKHFQPLHLATSGHYGSPPVKDCLRFLLENKEKFNLNINESRHRDFGHDMATPLHSACDSTSYEVMNLLFEHGADPDVSASRLDRDSYSEPEKLRYYTPLATCLSSLYLNECEYGCDVPYLICAIRIFRFGCNVLLHLDDTLSAMFRDFTCTVWCREQSTSYPFDATIGHVLSTSVPCKIGRVLLKMIFISICDDKQPFRTALYCLNFFKTEHLPREEEFLDNVSQWGWTEFFVPCSLLELSRDVVRKCLHRNIERKIASLDIPQSLKKYLNLEELDELKEEYVRIFDNEVDDNLVEMNRSFYDRENRKTMREKERPGTVEGFYYMNGYSDNMYSSDDSTENDQDNQLWSSEDE